MFNVILYTVISIFSNRICKALKNKQEIVIAKVIVQAM